MSYMENFIFVMSSTNASQIPVGVLLPSVYATIYYSSVFACQVYTVNYTSYDTIKVFKSKKLQSERRVRRVSIG